MTIEERIAMVNQKTQNDLKKKIKEKEMMEQKRNNMIKQIKSLKPRIDDLIKLANYAQSHNINFNKPGWGGHEDYDTGMFYTNCWSHLVGFVMNGNGDIEYLGINAGGACGNIDFRTNGEAIYGREEGTDEYVQPITMHLERFINKFNEFEQKFYAYIDKYCGKEG